MKRKLTFLLIAGIFALYSCSNMDQNTDQTEAEIKPALQVIAHRGGAKLAPENTLAAFRQAIGLGVDMIEIDVILSSDSAIIVIHDDKIDRTTDGSGVVKELSLAEIKQYDAGSWFDERFKGETVPTLEEVMETIAGKAILLIEIKDGDEKYPGLEKKVVDVIHRYQANDWVIVQSFNEQSVLRVREMDPSLITYYLMGGNTFPTFYENLISHPKPAKLPYNGVAVHHAAIDSTNARGLADAGYQLFVWTVNETPDMERILKIRPTGIITDLPDRLQTLLKAEAATE